MYLYFILMDIALHFPARMGGDWLSQLHKALRVHLIIRAGGSKYKLSQFSYRVEGRMCPGCTWCTPR